MSCAMAHSEEDPGAETRVFQAFVDSADRPTDFRSPQSRAPVALAIVGVAVVACVIVLILVS
jgi:hypothetical protein